jgi:hypothetical protein
MTPLISPAHRSSDALAFAVGLLLVIYLLVA